MREALTDQHLLGTQGKLCAHALKGCTTFNRGGRLKKREVMRAMVISLKIIYV